MRTPKNEWTPAMVFWLLFWYRVRHPFKYKKLKRRFEIGEGNRLLS
jgi:hypothetical protein